MSVQYVDGFTTLARQTINFPSLITTAGGQASVLYKAGWLPYGIINGTSAAGSTTQAIIQADTVFPSRNKMNIRKNSATAFTWLSLAMQAIETTPYDKFVIGFMCQFVPTVSSATTGPSICVLDGTALTQAPANSTSAPPGLLCRFYLPTDGVTAGIAYSAAGTETATSDQLKANVDTHYEILIETDVQRLRAYANGILVLDVTYTGTFKTKNGFGVGMWTGNNANNGNGTHDMIFSNMYVLGLDSVHTGVLGPGARVLEVAPQTDFSVQWDRPTGYASNAAVLQQYNDAATPAYLTAGLAATDLYVGPDAVAANAATIYGTAVKTYAMTMAEGTHVLTAATQYDGTNGQSAKSATLQLTTMTNYTFDVSLNPKTGLKWTPSEITAAAIGIKLLS
jgi:hypothetical protein